MTDAARAKALRMLASRSSRSTRSRGLKRLPTGVVRRQPDDTLAFNQVVMLAQDELPAFGRCGSVEDHHAQAGH